MDTSASEKILLAQAEESFCQRHRYRRFKGAKRVSWCAHLLLKNPCDYQTNLPCLIPHCLGDHLRVYSDRLGNPVIVVQPYVPPDLYLKITEEAVKFAGMWNLFFRISNEESWWQPGKTLLIEFWGKRPADV